MADPDLQLRVGERGGFDSFVLRALLPSVISFLTKIRGPSSRSAIGSDSWESSRVQHCLKKEMLTVTVVG